MTGVPICPNGHPIDPGDRFCAGCGAAIPPAPQAPPPPPPPPPAAPVAGPIPIQSRASASAGSWLPIAIGVVAAAAAIVTAIVVLGGDDTPTTNPTVAATTIDSTQGTAPIDSTSPTSPSETTPVATTPGIDPDSWTVLVYMVADNNLESFALSDLTEMSAVTPQDRFDIVVLVDRNIGESMDGVLGLPDWTDAKLLHIEGAQTTVLAEYGEADMGDPQVLSDFITTGIAQFPAAHYALMMWDHGATAFGIGPDDMGAGGERSSITPAELTPAIRSGLDAANVERLDILGFDACLMGSLEIAVHSAPVARYMVASEELEPGAGWDWTALEYLATDPHPTAVGLGTQIIDSYHIHPEVASRPGHTLSMVDLSLIDEVDAALGDLAAAMTTDMNTYAEFLNRQRQAVTEFGKQPDPWESYHMVDLGHLAHRIYKRSGPLGDLGLALRTSVDDAVVYSQKGSEVGTAYGIAVVFPGIPDYWDALLPYYDALAPTSWRAILDAYFTNGRAIPPERHPTFEAVGSEATAEFIEPSGLHVSADFEGAVPGDIADVRLLLGFQIDESISYYYSDYQGSIEGSTATAVHGLEAVYLDDQGRSGTDAVDGGAPVFFHRITRTGSGDGETTTVEIPVAYYPDGWEAGDDDWLNAALIDKYVYDEATDEWSFARDLFVTTESGTVASIPAGGDGLIAPLYLVDRPEGRDWEAFRPGSLAADLDALTLTIWTWGYPDTELKVELRIQDRGGNEAAATAVITVPADWMTAVG